MKQVRIVFALVILLGSAVHAQTNPVPIVYQPLSPMTVKPGSKGFTLTVNGFGFGTSAVISWNGKTRITNYISGSQLQIQVKAADVASPGTASVAVMNPAPGGGISNVVYFPIQTPTLSVAVYPAPGFSAPGAKAVGDFNNDGLIDLVVGRDLFVDYYAGNGDGTFKNPFSSHTVAEVRSVLAADFDADGKPDLAIQNGAANTTVLLDGIPKGNFVQQQVFRAWDGFPLAGDFNNDGNLDLVIMNRIYTEGSTSCVHLGSGDGLFGSAICFGGGIAWGKPASGDFNRDGNLDLAVPADDGVHVFLGNGDGTFGPDTVYQTSFAGSAAAAADVNGDGILDIVTDGVSILLGNGDGTFTNDGGVGVGGGSVNVGDFNGDGELDVVAGGSLLLGNGDGSFRNPIILVSDTLTAVGDFNGDGKLDFVGNLLYLQGLIYLTPSGLDFGSQKVGTQSPPQPATLTNDSSSALAITNIQITGTNPQDFSQTNDCGSSLPAGRQCSIKVVFQPQAQGSRSASLTVTYQGLGSPQVVSLTGVGQIATVTLTPANMKFPVQLVGTTSAAQTATLTNSGNLPVNISNISATAQFSEINNCPSSLPVGGSCQIQVEFAPQQRGQIAGKVSVTDDAQGSPQTLVLSGTGTVVKFSTVGVNFGNRKVGTKSSAAPVKLTNVGKSPLIIHLISITGTDPEDFSQTNNCGSKVLAGSSCTIKVVFAPQAKGKRSASLQVNDNGGGSPQNVALTGNGT